jgi:hypothetical protein
MVEISAFERQLAAESIRIVGPALPVDDLAVYDSVRTATGPRREASQALFGAARFVVAAAVVLSFGAALLVTQPFDRQSATAPGAASTTSPQPSTADCGPLQGQRELAVGCVYFTDFESIEVPTSGWVYDHDPSVVGAWSIAKGDARMVFLDLATPDGTYADPCTQTRGEPVMVRDDDSAAILQQSDDLTAAIAAIPGIEVVEGPSKSVEWNHVVIRIPEDACVPFGLWWDSDAGARWLDRAGDTIAIWIYNHQYITSSPAHPGGVVPAPPLRIWIEAQMPPDTDPRLEGEIQQILDSMRFPG